MPFDEDDWVEVLSSNSNYKGPGKLLALAYGTTWLVKVDRQDGLPGVVTVREAHMRDRGGPPTVKAPVLPDDEETYQKEQVAGLTARQIKRLERRAAKKKRE